jgi:hypothetical protein
VEFLAPQVDDRREGEKLTSRILSRPFRAGGAYPRSSRSSWWRARHPVTSASGAASSIRLAPLGRIVQAHRRITLAPIANCLPGKSGSVSKTVSPMAICHSL